MFIFIRDSLSLNNVFQAIIHWSSLRFFFWYAPLWSWHLHGGPHQSFCKIRRHPNHCYHTQIIWCRCYKQQRSSQDASQPCTSYCVYGGPFGYRVHRKSRKSFLITYPCPFQFWKKDEISLTLGNMRLSGYYAWGIQKMTLQSPIPHFGKDVLPSADVENRVTEMSTAPSFDTFETKGTVVRVPKFDVAHYCHNFQHHRIN